MLIICWQCINNYRTNYKRLVINITSSDQTIIIIIIIRMWIYEVFKTFISKILVQIEKIIIKLLFQEDKLRPRLNHVLWMDVPCALSQNKIVIKSNSFHYLSQPPTDFTITHQFYIENIYNATVSSLTDLLALLFAREEISSKCVLG